MAHGAYDKYVFGNAHLGGAPTKNLAVVMSIFDPGVSSGKHKHNVEEGFIILRGYGKATIGDTECELEPDLLLYAPAEVPHEFVNTGHESLVLLAMFSKSSYSCDRL